MNRFDVTQFPFLAYGDGNSHPLSTRYALLTDAQRDYPFATALTNEIDWCAIQLALNSTQSAIPSIPPMGSPYTYTKGNEVFLPKGTYLCDQPISAAQLAGVKLIGPGGCSPVSSNGGGGGATIVFTGTGIFNWTAAKPTLSGAHVTPTPANGVFYKCTQAGTTGATQPPFPAYAVTSLTPVWEKQTSYEVGSYVQPSPTPPNPQYYYRAISPGISGSTQPIFPTSKGSTISDGSVTWEFMGPASRDDPVIVIDGTVTWQWWNNTPFDCSCVPFMQFQSSQGCTIQDLSIIYDNLGFRGDLIDIGHAGPVASDTEKFTLRNVSMSGHNKDLQIGTGARYILNMREAICCLVDNCYFGVCQTAIHGVNWWQTSVGYSNAHTFTNNEFVYCKYAFGNAGQTWCIGPGNTFEGTGGAFWHIYHDDYPRLQSNTLQFFKSGNKITRTTGSFIDEGWSPVPSDGQPYGPVIVANSLTNDGDIGSVTEVTDSYIVVTGPSSGSLTDETSNTATVRYGADLPPAQARNLVFTPTGTTQTPKGLQCTGTIQRTDTASGGSFVVDGWQAHNYFEVYDNLPGLPPGPNTRGGNVTAVSDSTLTVLFPGDLFDPQTSPTALVALPEVGTGNLTFISNWAGDQFLTLPWMWFHGGASNINIIGGNSFQGSGRAAIFDGGGGRINIIGNQMLGLREPIAVNYHGISGMTVLNNITETNTTGNGISPMIGGITGGGLVSQYLIQGNDVITVVINHKPETLPTDAADLFLSSTMSIRRAAPAAPATSSTYALQIVQDGLGPLCLGRGATDGYIQDLNSGGVAIQDAGGNARIVGGGGKCSFGDTKNATNSTLEVHVGDCEVTSVGSGFILKDKNGKRWRIQVDVDPLGTPTLRATAV